MGEPLEVASAIGAGRGRGRGRCGVAQQRPPPTPLPGRAARPRAGGARSVRSPANPSQVTSPPRRAPRAPARSPSAGAPTAAASSARNEAPRRESTSTSAGRPPERRRLRRDGVEEPREMLAQRDRHGGGAGRGALAGAVDRLLRRATCEPAPRYVAGEAQRVEQPGLVPGDPGRRGDPAPTPRRQRGIPGADPTHLGEAVRAVEARPRRDVLPAREEPNEGRPSDRLDLAPQAAEREPVDAREDAALAPVWRVRRIGRRTAGTCRAGRALRSRAARAPVRRRPARGRCGRRARRRWRAEVSRPAADEREGRRGPRGSSRKEGE